MGSVYRPKLKSGGLCAVWWVKYYRDGKPLRESTGTAKKTEAKRFLTEREGRVVSGQPLMPRADRVRFDDLSADYLTDYRTNGRRSLEKAGTVVKHLKAAFGGRRAVDVTATEIRAYVAQRQAAGAANGTINRELAALKRMFRLACQADRLTRAPYVPMLQEHNVRTGFFSEADFLALRDRLPEALRAPADFAYTYGWRKEEILGLTWDRVDLQAGTVRLDPGTTKNTEGRTIILTPALSAALRALRQQTPAGTPWVFHRHGKPIKDLRGAWAAACTATQLTGRVFHDFRRTATRNMIRAGIPERVAMMITGHKTRSIFDRYNIVSEGDLREAAAKLTGTFWARSEGVPQEDAKLTIEK